jgi:hypothetical protein
MEEMSPQAPPSGDSRRKRRRQSTLSAESQRELGHMRTRRGTGSTSFVGSGSGIHFAQTVRHAFAQNSLKQRSVEAVDEELVPGEDDRLHYQNPPSSLWHGDELALEPEGSEVANAISFDDLVRWSRPYFDSWHPPFPFLHAPTVLGVMENVSMRGLSSLSHTDVVVVRSIMSISLADRRQLPKESVRPVLAHLVFRTIDDALCALQPSILQPSSLAGLQAVLAIQLFLISMLRLNAASRLGGLIVRMAFHLGLHRCPSRFSQFSAADNEIRRRVFWSIYCLERYLSQSLGLPLDLKDDDLDVCTPGSEHHSLPTNGSASNFTESNYGKSVYGF